MNFLKVNNIRSLLNWGEDALNRAGVPSPKVDAEWLMCYVLDCERIDLYLGDIEVGPAEEESYKRYIEKRSARYPLQYIIGKANFMGFDFILNEDVLIPRPETESLVEEALKICHTSLRGVPPLAGRRSNLNILDLCTGSGCIAISLAKLIPEAELVATDISEPALNVARRNAELHGVTDRVTFLQGDLFDALKPLGDVKFNIIVSNPPYIKTGDLESLPPEVQYEPRLALDGGEDGGRFYNEIYSAYRDYIGEPIHLFVEKSSQAII